MKKCDFVAISKALHQQNPRFILKTIEEIGFTDDGVPHELVFDQWYDLSSILNYISAYAVNRHDNPCVTFLVSKIIKMVALDVHLFRFLDMINLSLELEKTDADKLPKKVRDAIRNDEYTDEICEKILDFDLLRFYALIRYILRNVESISTRFCLPILEYIHSRKIISDSLLLSYIACCPRTDLDVMVDVFALKKTVVKLSDFLRYVQDEMPST